MPNVVAKIESTGNERILLTERGTSFGYNTLVADMRSLVLLRETGYPVIFDATHSVQRPGSLGNATGGQRDMVPVLARAAVAVGQLVRRAQTGFVRQYALSMLVGALAIALVLLIPLKTVEVAPVPAMVAVPLNSYR